MNPIKTSWTNAFFFPSGDETFSKYFAYSGFQFETAAFLNWKEEKKLEVFEISHLRSMGIREYKFVSTSV